MFLKKVQLSWEEIAFLGLFIIFEGISLGLFCFFSKHQKQFPIQFENFVKFLIFEDFKNIKIKF